MAVKSAQLNCKSQLTGGERIDGWELGRITPMPEVVPAGWRLIPLVSVARLESGHTPSRRKAEYWDGGTIPWVSLHDSKALDDCEITETAQEITQLGLENSSARLLPKGTVVFSRTATVGKSTLMGRKMATSQDFANYVCGPELHNHYLVHLFRHLGPEWHRLMAGSTHKTVYMPIFERLQVLLPPLPEQQAIAEVLQSVDDSIRATQEVIDQQRVVKQGLLKQLLTRGIGHTCFKQTEIGEVPESWEVRSLSSLSSRITKGTTPTTLGMEYVPDGVPFLRVVNITKDGAVAFDDLLHIEESTHQTLQRSQLVADDILISIAGTIGRTAVWQESYGHGNCNQAVAIVTLSSMDTSVPFIRSFLSSRCGQRLLVGESVQLAQANLSLGKIREVRVPIPPLSEQQAIEEVLRSVDDSIGAEQDKLAQLSTLKRGLMQDLLTGKVRMKVEH